MTPWLKQYRRNFFTSLLIFTFAAFEAGKLVPHRYLKTALSIIVLSLILALIFSIMDKWFDGFWYHLKYGKKKPKE